MKKLKISIILISILLSSSLFAFFGGERGGAGGGGSIDHVAFHSNDFSTFDVGEYGGGGIGGGSIDHVAFYSSDYNSFRNFYNSISEHDEINPNLNNNPASLFPLF